MELITDSSRLASLCTRASTHDHIAIDTEFMRERTYWPILCLVQIGLPGEAYAVDPMADDIDLAPLFDLMNSPSTLKVFHSARQDLEIFFHLTGQVPGPIFDTQIAAMVCGYADAVGYDRLVHDLTGQSLDKSMQYTNWTARPLGQQQIAYALADVMHLGAVYGRLSDQLNRTGRASWLAEEMNVLTDPATYCPDPDSMWKRIRTRHRKPENLAVLQAMAGWREITARSRNIPRTWVLKDETLADIAGRLPRSKSDLTSMRSLGRERYWRRYAGAILEVVERVRRTDPSCYPSDAHERPRLREKPPSELLRALLRLNCARHGVAQKLVASTSDLDRIAEDDRAEVPALSGWRREVFGYDALRLKRGEIALAMRGKDIEIINTGFPGGQAP